MEGKTTQEDFWQDRGEAEVIFRRLSVCREKLELWNALIQKTNELLEMISLMNENKDDEEIDELEKEYRDLKKQFDKAEIDLLLNQEYDKNDAILSIHAGTGGVDAQDWAEILLRMYLRYSDRKKYKSEILSISSGEEAGIKSVILKITGIDVYGYLKSESGVHRLVRQSPFNAKGLRHTSFALVEVVPFFEKKVELDIDKDELKIDTFRASGHGGQGVNTTDSAVRITHLPTGIVVSCQNERSQLQNKETAMKILMSKLYARKLKEVHEKEQLIKGETKQGSWGNQIRSYVLHPYQMVKDHRTDCETSQTDKVLDGDLDDFVESYLRNSVNAK